jgi:hypothetical protein
MARLLRGRGLMIQPTELGSGAGELLINLK